MAARLDSLTGLRFAAALFVVVHHVVTYNLADIGPGARLTAVGYVGVEFFFVLSGFVLTWSLRPGERARSFYRRRFARVYPLHLAFLIPGAILLVVGLIHVTAASIALTVPLLQAWSPSHGVVEPSLNPPDWSLSCEAFFYLCFPVLGALLVRQRSRRLYAVLGATVAAMVAVYAVSRLPALAAHGWWLVYTDPAYRIGEFAIGIVLALLVGRGALRLPSLRTACVLAGGALLALAASVHTLGSDRGATGLLMLPFCVLLIGAAAQADIGRAASPFRGRRWVKLGVWSYALYLAHFPMLMIALEIWPHGFSSSRAVGALAAVAFVLAAIAVAGLAHTYIEAPLERRLRGTRRPSAIQSQDADTGLAARRGALPAAVAHEASA